MSDTDAVAEIEALEDRRWAALLTSDVDALGELLADEMQYTHSNGLVDTKASYIEAISNGGFDYRSEDRTDTAVTVIDDTAMVTGRCAFTVVVAGGKRTVDLDCRYSTTWVRRDGAWQFLCYQSTPIPA